LAGGKRTFRRPRRPRECGRRSREAFRTRVAGHGRQIPRTPRRIDDGEVKSLSWWPHC